MTLAIIKTYTGSFKKHMHAHRSWLNFVSYKSLGGSGTTIRTDIM